MRRWADERNRDYYTYFAVIPGRPQIILKGESNAERSVRP